MSRLRYPFTEISARCRLCGAEGLTASSEHALGGRLIDWRRSHALVCPEWPRWAEKKGLRLDDRGALLYPNETGPYEPRIRLKPDDEAESDDEAGAEEATSADDGRTTLPSPPALEDREAGVAGKDLPATAALGLAAPAGENPAGDDLQGVLAVDLQPLTVEGDLMRVPAEQLQQAELF